MPRVPRLYVGPPGIGKTAKIRASYDHVEVFLLSSATEEDLTGLPWRDGELERRTKPGPFERLDAAAAEGKRTCLFLDEIDKARREVADTLLTLVADRRMGSWALPPECDIVAAANPPEWGGGSGLSDAMMSRFAIRRAVPDVEAWAAWLTKAYQHPLAGAVAKGVSRGQAPLFEQAGEGYDWRLTCPRTWELAIRTALSQADPVEERVQDINGLLTPNAAWFLIQECSALWQQQVLDQDEADVASSAREVAAGATSARRRKAFKPAVI